MHAPADLAALPAPGNTDPALRAVALFEAAKGVVSLVGAGALAFAGAARLQLWAGMLLARIQGHAPGTGWLQRMISADSVRLVALAIAAYGLLRLVEAWGLWRARAWASWLGCVSAALYLPFEVHALVRHPGWIAATVLAINLVIVAILGRDLLRRR
ncbi:DUF2127 domain-containing protein [Luteimonas composti]|uniref:DUF2127 domain-containing protein n=1 Tax=Luteimonas composti TaxID=398257 RepID=A0ABT6MV80_9GAMM|nr:DUF2127 domain-containing protein [Luteimonas composti]MDH7454210.1 DUF2127 domain-containing protein [Luteimonas composti]